MEDFAAPDEAGSYELCVFAGGGTLMMAVTTGAQGLCTDRSGSCWKGSGRALTYRGPLATGSGRLRLSLRPGPRVRTHSSILVSAKGRGLEMPALPFARPIVAQLRNRTSGVCWAAEHHHVHRNDPRRLIATGE